MGIDVTLFEATRYDTQSGVPPNRSITGCVMTAHVGAPLGDVTFLAYSDFDLDEMSVGGIGGISVAGVGPEASNAVPYPTRRASQFASLCRRSVYVESDCPKESVKNQY
ncbi:hypothetical protein N0A02_00460 [Paraburkholderia acidicola]|uniref:Uncharacterized protein n=1 Tax=Paraburkholderia acidicola TaxID=1912599 RepID=A0ABV1LGM9_9BURK